MEVRFTFVGGRDFGFHSGALAFSVKALGSSLALTLTMAPPQLEVLEGGRRRATREMRYQEAPQEISMPQRRQGVETIEIRHWGSR